MSAVVLRSRPLLLVLCCLLVAFAGDPGARGQEKAPGRGKGGRMKGKAAATTTELKKYDDVITKDAKTSSGVFMVHRIDDKVYFEIPHTALGKLMLWTIEVARGPAGVSWGGQSLGNNVIRWERRGNRIYLWKVAFAKRADGKAVQRAVDSANMDTILSSFSVEAEGKDRSAVIDVTNVFLSDVSSYAFRRPIAAATAVDDSRSYIEQVKAFPTNIEARSLLTFRGGAGGGMGGTTPTPGRGGRGGAGGGATYTAVLHYSIVQLPDQPMMGRYFDSRVGYFTESFEDYSANRGWMEQRQYISRYRLEKKEPSEEVSEPIKPIVFYLGREVPEKWRPYLKKGIEDWQPVFEKAGFKNAIIAKDAPSEREDPGWDPEDARHSVIRWVADPTQNAMGPHVHDPRSGEIISAHIIFWHDIVKLTQQWYFVQCGGSDPRVTQLPLPDDLIGDCLRYVCCHEVGHTLGLRHNHRASQAFTIAQLRDPKFTAKHGTVASIMSYGRFNYLAQPEDKVQSYLPKVGPYDYFAIDWGYRPIARAKSPEEERSTLSTWASRQLKEPWLRFGGEDGPATVDPTVLTENIGSDVFEATALGLKNLDRVMEKLIPATTRPGEDFALLEDAYRAVLRHRTSWFGAVAKQVGGVVEQRVLGGHEEPSFSRIPAEQQQKAVRFLLDNAFQTPKKLLSPSIVNRFKYAGVADEVMSQQKSLLTGLLSGRRLPLAARRRGGQSSEDLHGTPVPQRRPGGALERVAHGTADRRGGPPGAPAILHRPSQERAVSQGSCRADSNATAAHSAPPAARGATLSSDTKGTDFRALPAPRLTNLEKQLENVLVRRRDGTSRVEDSMTRAHLEDCLREIKLILQPKE